MSAIYSRVVREAVTEQGILSEILEEARSRFLEESSR